MTKEKEAGYDLINLIKIDGFKELWDKTDCETKDRIVNSVGNLAFHIVNIEDTNEKLESFVKWYWQEVDGKPYDISAKEIVESYGE